MGKDIKKYNFKQHEINICPDCKGFVDWNSYRQQFQCLSRECAFMADKDGKRIWDNSMRDENLKKMEEDLSR